MSNFCISIDIINLEINNLSLHVENEKIVIYLPNKTTIFEIIYLIASLLNYDSVQKLKATTTDFSISVTSKAINLTEIKEIIFKVQPKNDFICCYGKEEIINMCESTFEFW